MSQSHESLSDVLSAMVEAQPPLPDVGVHAEPLPEAMLRTPEQVPAPKPIEPELGMLAPAQAEAEAGGFGAQSMGFPVEEVAVVSEPLGPDAIERAVAESVPPDDFALAQASMESQGYGAAPTDAAVEPAQAQDWPAPDPVSNQEGPGGFAIPYGETYGGAPASKAGATRKPVMRRKAASSDLRGFAAPVCLTMGLLVVAPGVWSIMHLLSPVDTTVEGAKAPPAAMVYGLLLSWPVSLALIAAGVVMIAQLAAEKKRAAGKTGVRR